MATWSTATPTRRRRSEKHTQNLFAILFDRRYFLFVPAHLVLPLLIFTLPPTKALRYFPLKSLTLWAFAQLFRAVPWSHGTLGFLVAAELQVKNTTTPTHDTRYYNLYIKTTLSAPAIFRSIFFQK